MIHTDNIAMEPGSEASKAAWYCLNIHDEKTDYFMIHHSHAREADAVVDAVHRFHDAQPELRRWWTDAAPAFVAAARRIRSTRLLAHYKITPHRPQANWGAKRKNRLAIEGTRCLLT